MLNFSIGVDLGGTNLRIAAVNQQGDLMEKVTLGTRVGLGKDHVIHEMCDAIRLLAVKYRDGAALQGIGIGVPGIIDMKTACCVSLRIFRAGRSLRCRRRLRGCWAPA